MTAVLTEAMKQNQTGEAKPKPDMYTEFAENLWKTYEAVCNVGFTNEMAFDLLKIILGKGVK